MKTLIQRTAALQRRLGTSFDLVYRSIRMPVGDYCAVEAGPRQWGVIMLDGRVVVETRYSDVEISGNGKVRLTVFPGMTKTVDLSGM